MQIHMPTLARGRRFILQDVFHLLRITHIGGTLRNEPCQQLVRHEGRGPSPCPVVGDGAAPALPALVFSGCFFLFFELSVQPGGGGCFPNSFLKLEHFQMQHFVKMANDPKFRTGMTPSVFLWEIFGKSKMGIRMRKTTKGGIILGN